MFVSPRAHARFLVLCLAFVLAALASPGCSRNVPDFDSVTAEYDAAARNEPSAVEFVSSSLGETEAARLSDLSSSLESLRANLRIVGMSGAVVRDQKLVWARGYGHAYLESGVRATPRTTYSLASLTKPFGSALIMRLVESGDVGLDDPAADYGIDFPSPGVITVRHLLSHTSEGDPGSEYRYNGDRFGSLDRLLWTVSGRSFTETCSEDIIEPLGLRDTGFNPLDMSVLEHFLDFREKRGEPRAVFGSDGEAYALGEVSLQDPNIMTTGGSLETLLASVVDDSLFNLTLLPRLPVDDSTIESFREFWKEWDTSADVRARMARPYVIGGGGEPERGLYDMTTSCAAGVLSSVVDLARFDAAVDWDSLVSEESRELATTPTISTAGDTLPYGLGWFVHEFGGHKIVWHYGYWNCASTLIVKVPEKGLTFILLANTSALSSPFRIGGSSDVLVSPAAELFLRHIVFADDTPVELDWNSPVESIAAALDSADSSLERDLLAYEVGAAVHAAEAGLLTSQDPEELRLVR